MRLVIRTGSTDSRVWLVSRTDSKESNTRPRATHWRYKSRNTRLRYKASWRSGSTESRVWLIIRMGSRESSMRLRTMRWRWSAGGRAGVSM